MASTATFSGAQFDSLPYDESHRWELLEGELLEVPSPTPRHQEIVFRLMLALRLYLESSEVSALAYADVESALNELNRLRPDVSILLGQRAENLDPDRSPVPGAPDLAIEVISPTERSADSHDKVLAYLRNGSAEVWQVYPKSKTVQVYRGERSFSLDATQHLTTDLLPNFSLSVVSLFAN